MTVTFSSPSRGFQANYSPPLYSNQYRLQYPRIAANTSLQFFIATFGIKGARDNTPGPGMFAQAPSIVEIGGYFETSGVDGNARHSTEFKKEFKEVIKYNPTPKEIRFSKATLKFVDDISEEELLKRGSSFQDLLKKYLPDSVVNFILQKNTLIMEFPAPVPETIYFSVSREWGRGSDKKFNLTTQNAPPTFV